MFSLMSSDSPSSNEFPLNMSYFEVFPILSIISHQHNLSSFISHSFIIKEEVFLLININIKNFILKYGLFVKILKV